jgi:tRNA-(ms[2]io[6]A)-hydroxylase
MNDLIRTLPLRWTTPSGWAERVLNHPIALLVDHAYLERKAASNALLLLPRWPEPDPPENWTIAMTSIAREESEHLERVIRHLHKRGGRLDRTHRNPYAAGLHELVRLGRGPEELIDRLLVSALIEARSCERFMLLAAAAAGRDDELAAFYDELGTSEAGHYRVFLNLARQAAPAAAVEERWSEMLDAEARIIQAQPVAPRLHSGA